MPVHLHHDTVFVDLEDAGVVLTDQIFHAAHADKLVGGQFVERDLLVDEVLVRIVIRFENVHALVNLLDDFFDHHLVGVGRNGELVDAGYG